MESTLIKTVIEFETLSTFIFIISFFNLFFKSTFAIHDNYISCVALARIHNASELFHPSLCIVVSCSCAKDLCPYFPFSGLLLYTVGFSHWREAL